MSNLLVSLQFEFLKMMRLIYPNRSIEWYSNGIMHIYQNGFHDSTYRVGFQFLQKERLYLYYIIWFPKMENDIIVGWTSDEVQKTEVIFDLNTLFQISEKIFSEAGK